MSHTDSITSPTSPNESISVPLLALSKDDDAEISGVSTPSAAVQDSASASIADLEDLGMRRSGRQRGKRVIVRDTCCSELAGPDDPLKRAFIECNHPGCETLWVSELTFLNLTTLS